MGNRLTENKEKRSIYQVQLYFSSILVVTAKIRSEKKIAFKPLKIQANNEKKKILQPKNEEQQSKK